MVAAWFNLVLFASFFCLGQPLYVLLAPNLLRVDSSENVFVEAQGVSEPIQVTIRLLPFTTNQNLFETTIALSQSNNHQALVPVKIRSQAIPMDGKANHYATMRAEFHGKATVESTVLLSAHSRYIFVQTDKPIYNPTDTVHYRAFVTTTGAHSTNGTLTIEFKNPKGIVIEKVSQQRATNGIFSKIYKLPEVINEGTWELVAKLDDSPLNTFVSQFEVKEYVLPSFEVTVKPRKKFFHIDDEEFIVDISANYLYGEKVRGFAYVVFGFENHDKTRTNFPASFRRMELTEGFATLKKSDIKATVLNIESLLDHSLYVRVTVFTTTGTDLAEMEKSGIKIVRSPYQIHFTKTSKYFKPGMPYSLHIFVTNPDGSPADKIPVEVQPGGHQSTTISNGLATVVINTQPNDASKIFTVKTKHKKLPETHQAEKQMIVLAYTYQGTTPQNILYIGIPNVHISAGDRLSVNLNYHSDNPKQENQIKSTTYLIISKGKIIHHGSVQKDKSKVTAVTLTVTKDMIPSFRIVAYYTLPDQKKTEVVSDSVWVDVDDTCIGKLKVESLDRNTEYRPGEKFNMKVMGDPGATISLVAVDKAVFLLNDKNKLTQTKIWDEVEKHDIGCTAGGGKDSMSVFTDAGLLFKTSTGEGTTPRQVLHCPSPAKRKRRSVVLVEYKTTLESQYTDNQQRRCCHDGLTDIPMDYTCERRSLYITEGTECVKAFLHCCNEITNKKKGIDSTTGLLLSRSQENELLPDSEIRVRSQFDESWMWMNKVLPSSADKDDPDGLASVELSLALKDTITEWEILVISSSSTTGVCVAEPFDIRAKMTFFVDLKMPYSVIRNEQVEIKAILYNYASQPIEVQVDLVESKENKENRQICSLASNTGRYRQDVVVGEKSSRLVPYTIIPMRIGNTEIEVRANVYRQLTGDAVKKTLRILPEGMLRPIENTVLLNPSAKGGKQIIQFQKENLDSLVPGTTPLRFITATGDVLTDTIRNAISGSALTTLIRMPGGCVEQNVASMVFPVIATHYLDRSGDWERVGVGRRQEAIEYIDKGYARQMSYRNSDDSYPPYNKQASSTWLTAFVAKVFALAYPLTHIDDDRLCNSVRFLIQYKQLPDGSFTEDAPVVFPYYTGGLQGGDGKATLTAFVLIAMADAKSFCSSIQTSIQTSMGKAGRYLKSQLPSLSRPYSVAILSYALALMDNPDKSFLERYLGNSGSEGGTQWRDEYKSNTLEATGYALLAYLKMGRMDRATPIYEWLVRQGDANGGYGSTQSTMVVFQALAEYVIHEPPIENPELNLDLYISGRSTILKWRMEKGNYHVTKSQKININQNFTVEATGSGSGKLIVVTQYNALQKAEEQKKCKMYELEVNIDEAVAPPGTNKAYTLDIYMKYLDDHDGRMTILDISLPTGCVPLLSSLENLKNRVDQYIQYYNMDKQLSERGSLMIHLYKVLNTRQHLSITLIQEMQVGLMQPAAVTIYDYYASENRCTKFYHPNKKHAELGRICRGDLCHCAEESCSALKKYTKEITLQTRMEEACKGVSYVYKVQVSEIVLRQDYDDYIVVIKQVIKQGEGEVSENEKRTFLSHVSCRESLNVRKGEEYLFIGRPEDTMSSNTHGEPAMHILGSETWLEWWPHDQDCQTEEKQETCEVLAAFDDELRNYGCPN